MVCFVVKKEKKPCVVHIIYEEICGIGGQCVMVACRYVKKLPP